MRRRDTRHTRRFRSRVARDERILAVLPVALIEYPLEVLLAFWGVVSGAAVLVGVSSPSSISHLLPAPVARSWAAAMVVAGATIAYGLVRGHYAASVARGLQLLGATCALYALAIAVAVGARQGIPAGPLLTVIALLCYLRAWWLRCRERVLRRIEHAVDVDGRAR